MKKLVLFTLLIWNFMGLNAQTYKQKLDNRFTEKWDSSKYTSYIKTDYTYNATGELTQEVISTWNVKKKQLVNSSKYEYVIDAKGNNKTITYYHFDTIKGFYVYNIKEYTYDNNNDLILITQSGLDTKINQIRGIQKIECTFDNSHNITNEYFWWFDVAINKFVPNASYSYTYDPNKNKLSKFNYSWDSTAKTWKNTYKSFYEYNTSNKLIQEIDIMWNSLISKFDTSYLRVYAYDSYNNLTNYIINWKNQNKWYPQVEDFKYSYDFDTKGNILIKTTTRWESGSKKFVNSSKTTYTYNQKNDIETQAGSNWDNTTNSWLNTYKFDNTLDTAIGSNELVLPFTTDQNNSLFKHKLIRQIELSWDKKLSNWVNNKKNTYNYSITNINRTKEIPVNFELIVFPNPSSENIYINLPNNTGKTEVRIMDITGKIVLREDFSNKGFVDISNLGKGLYFIALYERNTLLGTGKLVKD